MAWTSHLNGRDLTVLVMFVSNSFSVFDGVCAKEVGALVGIVFSLQLNRHAVCALHFPSSLETNRMPARAAA